MKTKTVLACMALATLSVQTAVAGGILTNTNQSIDFLRNPAREAAIGLDGVYSNPAGVAFLPEGLHIGFNWQYAHQTRTITSTDESFKYGRKNNGATTKTYEGVADAPCIPSVQAAWNKGDWSLQFNFSVPGGGGKCEYSDGLGTFERVVGGIANKFQAIDLFATKLNGASQLYTMMGRPTPAPLPTHGVSGYDMDSYMQGRQYYFGLQLGAAYKATENFSVYGGLRLLWGQATYKAKINNIMVNTANGLVGFESFLPNVPVQAASVAARAQEVLGIINTAQQSGITLPQQVLDQKTEITNGLASLQAGQSELAALQKYSEGVNLLCNQSGLGIAPVLGVDYRLGRWNMAVKYEFKTQMRMKNESTVFEASEIEAVNKYRDGESVNEDQPALLTVGVQYSPIDAVRINAGWHYYFDKDANWYGNAQEQLDHNTNEFLLGAEWDINNRLTVSAGGQLTRYGLTDQYMNDMSFVVNSYSLGFGANYKLSDVVTVKAAYFQTNYTNYKRTQPTTDTFTRSNRVLGIACELTL